MYRLEHCFTYLLLRTGEVVGRLEGTGDTLLDGGITTVVGAEDRVLEPTGVLDVHVDLAVLAVLDGLDIGTNRGNVGIEDERHDGAVRRDLVAHGALRASRSTIGDTADGNLDVLELGLREPVVGCLPGLVGEHRQVGRQGSRPARRRRGGGEQGATSF